MRVMDDLSSSNHHPARLVTTYGISNCWAGAQGHQSLTSGQSCIVGTRHASIQIIIRDSFFAEFMYLPYTTHGYNMCSEMVCRQPQ